MDLFYGYLMKLPLALLGQSTFKFIWAKLSDHRFPWFFSLIRLLVLCDFLWNIKLPIPNEINTINYIISFIISDLIPPEMFFFEEIKHSLDLLFSQWWKYSKCSEEVDSIIKLTLLGVPNDYLIVIFVDNCEWCGLSANYSSGSSLICH